MLPVKTITEHAHNLYRMSSNLRSIAYDLHYCPDSKNYRRPNKMTFSPDLYIIYLKKWTVYVLYIFNLYIYHEIGLVVSEEKIKWTIKISSPFFLFLAWWPSWLEVGITGHNFGRVPSKDHSTKVWLQLAQWFLRRRLKCEMLTDGRRTKSDGNSSHGLKARWGKKGIYVKLLLAM